MANDEDNSWLFWLVIAGLIGWYLWGGKPLEEREDYKSGYDAGHADGYEEGHNVGLEAGKREICDEVEYRLNSGAASAVGC